MLHGTITIDEERCKGCELCVNFCPQHVISLASENFNAKGYHPALLTETETNLCTGCGICAVVCPDVCITVFREPQKVRA